MKNYCSGYYGENCSDDKCLYLKNETESCQDCKFNKGCVDCYYRNSQYCTRFWNKKKKDDNLYE